MLEGLPASGVIASQRIVVHCEESRFAKARVVKYRRWKRKRKGGLSGLGTWSLRLRAALERRAFGEGVSFGRRRRMPAGWQLEPFLAVFAFRLGVHTSAGAGRELPGKEHPEPLWQARAAQKPRRQSPTTPPPALHLASQRSNARETTPVRGTRSHGQLHLHMRSSSLCAADVAPQKDPPNIDSLQHRAATGRQGRRVAVAPARYK